MSTLANIPRLFDSTSSIFNTQGQGALTDVVSVSVIEGLNGGMELTMVYPVTGIHFEDIVTRALILCKPNPIADPYPFRIYSISKPLNGKCTIHAHGWHYDLSGIPIAPFDSASVAGVISAFNSDTSVPHLFTFSSDMGGTSGAFNLTHPASVYATMGGTEGSVIDTFGGEWLYGYGNDPQQIRLVSRRGGDNGVTIRYGKNLTQLEQEENISAVYTGVYPYWQGAEGELVTLPEEILPVSGSFSFDRILTLDMTADFEEMPDEDALRNAALAYMSANSIGVPSVSLKVSFVALGQTDQYKSMAMLEDVELGDGVTVQFEALGVNASARVIETDYNPITGRYNSVSLGSARATIADTIAAQSTAVTRLENTVTSPVIAAVQRATDKLIGNLGGYVVMRYNGDGLPEELLIMDTPDIETATKVWRWNQQGLGYSSTGYTGVYGLAMTSDGEIVADYITTGHMAADIITMGANPGDELTDYFRVYLDENSRAVVELGADENQIVLKLQNDRISFFDTQGNELAYFSDNSFRIVNLAAFELQNLKVAVLDNGAYGFMAAQ